MSGSRQTRIGNWGVEIQLKNIELRLKYVDTWLFAHSTCAQWPEHVLGVAECNLCHCASVSTREVIFWEPAIETLSNRM